MENKQELVKVDEKNEIELRTSEGFIAVAKHYIKNNGAIIIPPNYDVNSAVKALYLKCLETTDKQGRPVLEFCTQTSIESAIQRYIDNGLNCQKDQCYLVPRGKTLCLDIGYRGKEKMAKTYAGIKINSNVIYKGEEVNIEQRIDGSKIIHHNPDFSKFDIDNIVGAYAVAVREDGTVDDSEIMTIKEIQRSWAKSATGGTVHKEFPVQMARKTVIGRLAKRYINTSDDSSKFNMIETDIGDYYANEEINADDVIITDNAEISKQKNVSRPVENSENEMVIDELNEENIKEIPYSEFKNNTDKYRAVPNSYDKDTKTIRVYC